MLDALEVARRMSDLPDDKTTQVMVYAAIKFFVKTLYAAGFEITPVLQGNDAAYLMRRWVGKESE